MKVTVNLPEAPVDENGEEVGVEVSHPFPLVDDPDHRMYINLGVFKQGDTEVDDILVTRFGCSPVDVVVGTPEPEPEGEV